MGAVPWNESKQSKVEGGRPGYEHCKYSKVNGLNVPMCCRFIKWGEEPERCQRRLEGRGPEK